MAMLSPFLARGVETEAVAVEYIYCKLFRFSTQFSLPNLITLSKSKDKPLLKSEIYISINIKFIIINFDSRHYIFLKDLMES